MQVGARRLKFGVNVADGIENKTVYGTLGPIFTLDRCKLAVSPIGVEKK